MDTEITLENQLPLFPLDRPKILALYSSQPGSGKSTAALHLANKGFACVKFAMPLKSMLKTLLEYMGYNHEAIIDRMIEGNLKEANLFGFDLSPRYLMQTLGSEWGRDCLDKNFWVKIAQKRISEYLYEGKPVVIDDLRFENEYEALKLMGATLVKIDRPSNKKSETHQSEGALDQKPFDHIITNDASIELFQTKIETLI